MEESPILRAGVFQADITPPVGITHVNWGAAQHDRAEGVDFPFRTTVMWISDGVTTVVLCDIDRGLVPTTEATALRNAISAAVDVPATHVRISFTHTHAGPLVTYGKGQRSGPGRELVAAYVASVRDQTIGAARAARSLAQPVVQRSGYAFADVAVNRRRDVEGTVLVGEEPDGVTDHHVLVSRFSTPDGTPVAAILGYSAHPITLGHENRYLSPDYPGFARDELQKLTGATVLFLQGSAGDQMARGGLTADRSVARRTGAQIAFAAAATFMSLGEDHTRRPVAEVLQSGAPLALLEPPVAPEPRGSVLCLNETVGLPVRDYLSVKEATEAVNVNIARLDAARQSGNGDAIAYAMMRAKRSEAARFFAEWIGDSGEGPVEMQTIVIGDLALVGVPAEPFAELGVLVRSGSPFPVTFFSGYTNGWHGYIPTPREFDRGGYEIEIASVFARNAGDVLVDIALSQLEKADHRLKRSLTALP